MGLNIMDRVVCIVIRRPGFCMNMVVGWHHGVWVVIVEVSIGKVVLERLKDYEPENFLLVRIGGSDS